MDLDLATSDLSRPVKSVDFNLTNLAVFQVTQDTEVTALSDPVYEQFLADVWVGIVLTLMVLSCVCFMCSCLIYHKFQEWKHRAGSNGRNSSDVESSTVPEADLPSYTIASGLPTYEEALEQLKKVHHNHHSQMPKAQPPDTTPLSVLTLFAVYDKNGAESGGGGGGRGGGGGASKPT